MRGRTVEVLAPDERGRRTGLTGPEAGEPRVPARPVGAAQGCSGLAADDTTMTALVGLMTAPDRAAAVQAWLQAHGVADGRLQAQGRGASEPVAPNQHPDGRDNPEGRAKNRRVEAIIPKP